MHVGIPKDFHIQVGNKLFVDMYWGQCIKGRKIRTKRLLKQKEQSIRETTVTIQKKSQGAA